MIYLQKRNEFIKKRSDENSDLITETFENDITLGGSLLGRFINSTLRKAKISINQSGIDPLSKKLEKYLDELLVVSRIDDEKMVQVKELETRSLINEIIKVVRSGDSVEKKISILVEGDSNPGLVKETIESIKKIENLKDKEELIEKLENFLKSLKELGFEKDVDGGDEKNVDGGDEDEKNVDGGDEDKKGISFIKNSKMIFESLIRIYQIILSNRVTVEVDASTQNIKSGNPLGLDPGKEVYYKNNLVKIINTKFIQKAGPDKTYLTKDDVVDNRKPISPKILVVQKNPKTDKYDDQSKSFLVGSNELKLPKNESLFILENAIIIGKNETHARSAWIKIKNSFKNSNMDVVSKQITDLLNILQSGGIKNYRDISTKIFIQVIKDENTIGKKLSFEDLIKEDTQSLHPYSEFKDIPKSISLISRVILSLKEDRSLIKSFGEASKSIENFINGYEFIKKTLSNQKSNESIILESDGGENKDIVIEKWEKEFTKDDEKKYSIDAQKANALKNEIGENKKVEIDPEKHMDLIIKIVEVFGKAYRLYAVDYIPSGRPNGRTSLKTFREYKYIGSGSSVPGWTEQSSAGFGPWAVIKIYQKWQDKIMSILSDTKYRSILSNSKFKNVGPYQKEGAGLTLFTFINDMVNEDDQSGSFTKRRHKLLSKYFGGTIGKEVEDKSGKVIANDNPQIPKEEMGEPNTADFYTLYQLLGASRKTLIKSDFNENGKLHRSFIKIEFSGDKIDNKNSKSMICFVYAKPKKDNVIILKCQLGPNQDIINSYLSDRKDIKMDNFKPKPSETYAGFLEFPEQGDVVLKDGQKVKFKYSYVDDLENVKEADIIIKSLKILGCVDSKKNLTILKATSEPHKSKSDIGNLLNKFKDSEELRKKIIG